MSNPIWELFVRIAADSKPFQSGMDAAERATEKAARKWRALGDEMVTLGSKMTAAVTLPLAAIGIASVKTAADMDALKRGLIAVSGSSDAAEKQLVRLKEVAKLPGLGFEEAVRGATNLQAAGISAQLSERALRGFGNALATVGKGRADLDGVITALSQIATKGKVSAEEINQLAERVPQIRKVMQDVFGTADTELIQKAGISSQKFIEVIVKEFEKLPPVTGGLKNDLENIRDQIQQTATKIGNALAPAVSSALKSIEPVIVKVGEMAEDFAKLPPTIQSFAIASGAAFAAGGPLLIGIGMGVKTVADLASAIWGADKAGKALALTLRGIPYLAAAAAVATLVAAYRDFVDAQEDSEKAQKTAAVTLNRLETHLRQHGANIDALAAQYSHGEISFAEYLTALRKIAAEMGATDKVVEKSGENFKITANKITDAQKRMAEAHFAMIDRYDAEFAALAKKYPALRAEQLIIERITKGYEGAAEAVYKFITAGEAWGEKFPIADIPESQLEQMTRRENARSTIGIFAPPDQMDVDWTRAGRGTSLETATAAGGSVELRRIAQAAAQEAQRVRDMWQEGKASQEDYLRAQAAATEAEKRATGATKEHSATMTDFGREVRKAYDHMRQGIAESLVEWKGFGATGLNIIKDLAKGITEILVGRALKALAGSLTGVLGQLGGIGKALGGLLGGGGWAQPSMTGAPWPGASGGGASAGGGTAGAASSGVMGIIGAAASVGTMISSIFGNFQNARMEKTMNAIEESTRYLKIYTGQQADSVLETLHIVRNTLTDWFRWYADVDMTYQQKQTTALESIAAGGGGGRGGSAVYTFNNCSFGAGLNAAMVRNIFEQARAAQG